MNWGWLGSFAACVRIYLFRLFRTYYVIFFSSEEAPLSHSESCSLTVIWITNLPQSTEAQKVCSCQNYSGDGKDWPFGFMCFLVFRFMCLWMFECIVVAHTWLIENRYKTMKYEKASGYMGNCTIVILDYSEIATTYRWKREHQHMLRNKRGKWKQRNKSTENVSLVSSYWQVVPLALIVLKL